MAPEKPGSEAENARLASNPGRIGDVECLKERDSGHQEAGFGRLNVSSFWVKASGEINRHGFGLSYKYPTIDVRETVGYDRYDRMLQQYCVRRRTWSHWVLKDRSVLLSCSLHPTGDTLRLR